MRFQSFVNLLISIMLFQASKNIEITLIHSSTCVQFQVEQIQNTILFSYHFNPHTDEVNMIIYDKNVKVINQTGSDINYHHYLEIKFNETGLYPICFEKVTSKVAEVQYDILKESEKMRTAGKQDINKITRKISQFLIDIKRTSWEFKQILEQNDKISSKLSTNQNNNYMIFTVKMVVMVAILAIQFYAIKYIFQ